MVAFFQQVGGADDRMFFAPVRAATRADKEKLATTPTVGVKVMAPWTNGKLYPGKVSRVTGAGVVTILFDDGDTRAGVAWTACTARATDTDRFGLSRQWSESLRTWYYRRASEEERPLCSNMAAWNFLAAALYFNLWGDVPSGCAFAVLVVSLLLANKGKMRAGRVLHGLGLLLLAVAFVMICMKTHRVRSIGDPTCGTWAGACQAGGQRDGRIECGDCSDPATCVDRSAAGYWWSERGARYFPHSQGTYAGREETRRLNGCGLPQKPRTHGAGKLGAYKKQKWKRVKKEEGACRPLFTSRAKCERYWRRWQDAWRGEWTEWLIAALIWQALLVLWNIQEFKIIEEFGVPSSALAGGGGG